MSKFAFFGVSVIVAATLCSAGSHHKEERMFMSRSMGSDLVPSATGYIYRSDNNGPASLVQLGAGAIHQHLNAFPSVGYPHGANGYPNGANGYAPIVEPIRYTAPIVTSFHGYIPSSHLTAGVPALDKNSYGETLKDIVTEDSSDDSKDDDSNDESSDEESQGYSSDESSDDKLDSGDDYSDENIAKPNYAADFEADAGNGVGGHEHSSGGGKSYGAADHSAHGEKGDKGYKAQSSFDKGESGKHFKDGHKGEYSEGAGHKAGHSDSGNHYAQHHAGSKGYKGGDFGESKGHKKGSKTTGFHNVYHKDEYKKDHDFYDDANNSGHFNKHGSNGANHHASKGGHSEGGKHDSAYNHDSYGKKGFSDKGQASSADKGHTSKGGDEAFYKNYSDYGKKGGESGGEEHGYAGKH